MTIKVLVAAHKEYEMPKDPMYLPVHVGAALKDDRIEGFTGDDSGDNISIKNPLYCELTALYWGWKNLQTDYLGLVHYRRHFMRSAGAFSWDNVLDRETALQIFSKGVKAILPKKRHYVIETIYSHYEHSHHREDLIVTADVITSCFPEYTDAFAEVMKCRSAHMFNMCIMEKKTLDEYCSWLFAVLDLVEKNLDISGYSDFDKRVFGRISELLLDVWIRKNNITYAEVPVRNPEGEHLVSKVIKVVRRKLFK